MCYLNSIIDFFTAHIGNFLAAFGGAGFGSSLTYLYQRRKEKANVQDKRYAAVLEAKMVVCFHISTIIDYRKQIEPYRGKEKEGFFFGLKYSTPNQSKIDLNSLSFIAHESKNPNLLLDLNLGESRYFGTLEAYELRNQLHSKFMKEGKIEKTDDIVKVSVPENSINAQHLKDCTSSLFEFVDNTEPFLLKVMKQLNELSSELFPDKKPVIFTPKESTM